MKSILGILRKIKNRNGQSVAVGSPTTVLGRVRSIVRADIEDLLNGADDPEKMADEMLADYSAALKEARSAVSEAISALRDGQGRQAEDEAEIATWTDRAELAAARALTLQAKDPKGAADAERLGLAALKKERMLQIRIDERRPFLEDQLELVEGLKAGIEQMEERYARLESQRDTLLSRARFAAAQSTVATVTQATDERNPVSKLSALERSVREREALAQGRMEIAMSSPEAQFRQLDSEASAISAQQEFKQIMERSAKALGERTR